MVTKCLCACKAAFRISSRRLFFFFFLSCDVIKPNDSCGKMMQELEVKLSMVAHCNKSQHFEHLFLWVRDD